jgi:hypothetical protein
LIKEAAFISSTFDTSNEIEILEVLATLNFNS